MALELWPQGIQPITTTAAPPAQQTIARPIPPGKNLIDTDLVSNNNLIASQFKIAPLSGSPWPSLGESDKSVYCRYRNHLIKLQ